MNALACPSNCRRNTGLEVKARGIRLAAGVALAFGYLGVLADAQTTIYVATNGRDTWSGSLSAPNANQTDGPRLTLNGARLRISQLKQQNQLSPLGANVVFMPGTYTFNTTQYFSAADSGTPTAPIVYKALVPRSVYFEGGRTVSGWQPLRDTGMLQRVPVAARRRIVELNLASQGISDTGSIKATGFYQTVVTSPLELFVDDEPATLAKWPNAGWATIGAATGSRGLRMSATRPRTWRSNSDTWVHGYFGNNYADFRSKITGISPSTGDLTMQDATTYGITAGLRYRVVNAPEELDMPGEYYVDRSSGKLFYWPRTPIQSSRTVVSMLEGPIIQAQNTANVRFQGIVFRYGRGNAINSYTTDGLSVVNCEMKNLGQRGFFGWGVTRNRVEACDIYNTGYSGIYIQGGDRATLTSGANLVLNNAIHDVANVVQGSEAGVYIVGVGTRVANNAIHDMACDAVVFHGNDHVIEKNEIVRVCREKGDAGAIYTVDDMTMQGNIVRNNLIREVVARAPSASLNRLTGVYLDNFTSGTTVYGNAIVDSSVGIHITGGRDNIVQNNIFLRCGMSIYADSRGMTWNPAPVMPGGAVYNRLRAFNLNSLPWNGAYPNLPSYLVDDLRQPKRNNVQYNLYLDSQGGLIPADSFFLGGFNTVVQNITDGASVLQDPAHWDFGIVPGSSATLIPFVPIDLNTVGCYLDGNRSSMPNLRIESIQFVLPIQPIPPVHEHVGPPIRLLGGNIPPK